MRGIRARLDGQIERLELEQVLPDDHPAARQQDLADVQVLRHVVVGVRERRDARRERSRRPRERARAILLSREIKHGARAIGRGGDHGCAFVRGVRQVQPKRRAVDRRREVGLPPAIRRLILDPGTQVIVVDQAVEQLAVAGTLFRVRRVALQDLGQRELRANDAPIAVGVFSGGREDVEELELARIARLEGFERDHRVGRSERSQGVGGLERQLPALGDLVARIEGDQELGTNAVRHGRRAVTDAARRERVGAVEELLVPQHKVLDRLDRPLPALALGQELGPLQLDVDDAAALVRDEVDRLIPVIANHDVHSDRTAGRCHLAFNREAIVIAGERDGLSARGARRHRHERHGKARSNRIARRCTRQIHAVD